MPIQFYVAIILIMAVALFGCETRTRPKTPKAPTNVQREATPEKAFPFCEEINDESAALEVARASEKLIDRNHQFMCSDEQDVWSESVHQNLKNQGYNLVKLKTQNNKPNNYQRRLELDFVYQNAKGEQKYFYTSCEMNAETKEWVSKNSPPEC